MVGTDMVIWGGKAGGLLNDGAVFNTITPAWTPMTTTGAPTPRKGMAAVSTGAEMIIWGGWDGSTGHFADGAKYNPSSNTWVPINVSPLSARKNPAVVWTGTHVIIWGGSNASGPLNDGAKYFPGTDTWVPIEPFGSPRGRDLPVAAWDGTAGRMIVFGGYSAGGTYPRYGGVYNPGPNTWQSTTDSGTFPSTGSSSGTFIWAGADDYFFFGGVGNASTDLLKLTAP
jgi:N-acetylneuraminic acid mutarotase